MLEYLKKGVNIYDATTTNIEINGNAILAGYFREKRGMWNTHLKDKAENEAYPKKSCTLKLENYWSIDTSLFDNIFENNGASCMTKNW